MANNIATGAINGAEPATFSLSFLNSMQQNTGANNIVATTQNGYKPGDLVSYQINDDDSNLLIVFYVQIMPDDFVMQLHRF